MSKKIRAREESEGSESDGYLSVEESNPLLKKDMHALLSQLKETMEAKERSKLIKSKHRSPVLIYLNKYKKVLELTLPEEHRDYFMAVYNKYRIPILSNKSDKWLRKNNVQIVYDDTKIKIMLSSIYTIACQLCEDAEKRLDGFPEEAYEECVDLIRKDIILLHLYRIFREFAPEKDIKQLSRVVRDFEEVLGLESGAEPEKGLADTPLGNLGALASNLMKGLNQTAAENGISPEEVPDMGKIIASVFENDALQGIMKNLMTAVSGGEGGEGGREGTPSLETALGQVVKTITSREFKDTIIGAASETTEQTIEVPTDGPKGLPVRYGVGSDEPKTQ